MELTVWKAFQGHIFQLSIERAKMKTQTILLIFERLLYPLLVDLDFDQENRLRATLQNYVLW